MNILLIAGGWSSEREVSLNGARNIEETLLKNGHNVTFFDLARDFDNLATEAKKHDFAFINLHGSPGEDGLPQAILDACGTPYQGSDPAGSFLALNKAAAKQIYKLNGLPTPEWEFLPLPPKPNWRPRMNFPIFVKSVTGGSSLRLSRVNNQSELDAALAQIFASGEEAIIEPAIKGRDITCAVLGDRALPPLLILPVAGEYFDYESKYAKGGAREICPAPEPAELLANIQTMALQAHEILGLSGCSRSDFIVDEENRAYILETNTLPGMTATSLAPQEAAAAGIDFSTFLETLISLGEKRFREKRDSHK